ncbi:MAG: hypothetical protein AB8B69_00755 [Chitinophagales bacterium]
MKLIKYWFIAVLLIAASFIYSCDVAPDCTVTDDMEEFDGLQGEVDIAIYDSIFLLPHVLDTSVHVGDEYRINSETVYEALMPTENCPDCRLPPINLDTHTLIGKYLNEPCLAVFGRKWIKVDETHYRYLIKVTQDNRCVTASCLNFSFNFIAVPKLPDNAEVTIEVGHGTTDCDC